MLIYLQCHFRNTNINACTVGKYAHSNLRVQILTQEFKSMCECRYRQIKLNYLV